MLWERWRTSQEIAARDALILRHSAWARLLARDICMRVYWLRDAWHDCTQNALIGLIEAMSRFDPDHGVSFQAYARYRVRGAVFDGLRAMKENGTQATPSHDYATATAERLASFEETDAADPLEAMVATTIGLGLGFLLENQMASDHASGDAYADLERRELSTAVGALMQQLPDRERMIVTMHYYHHIPFVEIAAGMGITKGRVSQLHRRALDLLRVSLRERFPQEY